MYSPLLKRLLLVAVAFAVPFSAAQAGPLNPDFTSASWTVAGDGGVTVGAGNVATIHESMFDSETDLYQVFDFKSTNTSLSFQLTGLFADSAVGGGTPDSFGVSLLDNLGNPLVPTVVGSTDSYYIRDIVTGFPDGQAATGVTVSGGPGFPITITVDTSLVGDVNDAKILFRVIGGTDLDSSSSASITNVQVNGGAPPATIPEPGSIVLLSMGILGLAGHAWRFHRRDSRASRSN